MDAYLNMLGPFQAPLTFLLIIAGPPIFRTLANGTKRFLDARVNVKSKTQNNTQATPGPRRVPHAVFWIVGIHTAVFVYLYCYLQPFNLFTKYFLPVTANARILHSAIHSDETGWASPQYPNPAYQHSSQPGHVATSYLDILAKKLTNSLDNRLLYLRFGHSIFTAAWPRTVPEYMLLKLPEVALWYLTELGICVFGICNIDWKAKGGYKQSFTWITILAVAAEVWGRLFWPLMVVEGEAIPLDTIIFKIRIIFLGLLPILLMLLPDYPPESSDLRLSETAANIQRCRELVNQSAGSMSSALTITRYLRLMDESIMANPPLRELRSREAEAEKAVREAIMANREFREETDKFFGWVDDNEELDANGNVISVRGKSLVANGLRQAMRTYVGGLWNQLGQISEMFAERYLEAQKENSVTAKDMPAQAIPSHPDGAALSDQPLRRRVKSPK